MRMAAEWRRIKLDILIEHAIEPDTKPAHAPIRNNGSAKLNLCRNSIGRTHLIDIEVYRWRRLTQRPVERIRTHKAR